VYDPWSTIGSGVEKHPTDARAPTAPVYVGVPDCEATVGDGAGVAVTTCTSRHDAANAALKVAENMLTEMEERG
jgi:hypothetical protein